MDELRRRLVDAVRLDGRPKSNGLVGSEGRRLEDDRRRRLLNGDLGRRLLLDLDLLQTITPF